MGFSALIVCSRQKNREDRHHKNRSTNRQSADYTEETGYMYRASATPDYPTAPPYNPEYPAHQNPYADHYRHTTDIPPATPYHQRPLPTTTYYYLPTYTL